MPVDETIANSNKLIQVNGIDMFYVRAGSGHPVIMLHGGTASHRYWDEHVQILKEEFELIVPDMRGHGRSTNPSGNITYSDMADDIAELIQALGLDLPIVCGWSDGGHVALDVGIRYDEIIRGLVIGGVEIKHEDGHYEMLANMGVLAAGEVDIDKIEEDAPDWVEMLRMLHTSDEHWQTLLLQLSELWYAPLEYPVETLESLKAPTLITLGDRDQFVPVSHASYMYESIPNSELAIMPGADHSVSRAKPHLYSELISQFAGRLEDAVGESEA